MIAKAIGGPEDAPQMYLHSSSTEGVALVAAPVVTKEKVQLHTIEAMVRAEFVDAPIMVDIARAESRFNPLAKNPKSTATGVFQILVGTWADYGCVGSRTDAHDNIKCARIIYERSGTTPWISSKANW